MNKISLVTGATSGIGEATARALSEDGYDVIITGRRAERLRTLKSELESEFGNSVQVLCFDVRDERSVESALNSLPEGFRHIDVLVNNAGLAAGLEHIYQGDTKDWNDMIDTNIKGVLYVTRYISKGMVTRGTGHIVNIGSMAGLQTYENGGVYCASKYALHALSQSMRIDLLSHGIRVTEICPGMVETEFSVVRFHGDQQRAKSVYDNLEPLQGEDIAEAILWALSQPDHVNIDQITITPKAQANTFYCHRGVKKNSK